MLINHDCLKAILNVFAESEEADMPLLNVVESPLLYEFNEEQLKFHLQRMADLRWIVSNTTNQTYEMLDKQGRTQWSYARWRWTEYASQYWDASEQIPVWEEFKKRTGKESLDFSFQLLKGYSQKWLEKKISEFEI